MAEQVGIPRDVTKDMTLEEIQGWTHAAIVARHRLNGGTYDDETGEFFPPESVGDFDGDVS